MVVERCRHAVEAQVLELVQGVGRYYQASLDEVIGSSRRRGQRTPPRADRAGARSAQSAAGSESHCGCRSATADPCLTKLRPADDGHRHPDAAAPATGATAIVRINVNWSFIVTSPTVGAGRCHATRRSLPYSRTLLLSCGIEITTRAPSSRARTPAERPLRFHFSGTRPLVNFP